MLVDLSERVWKCGRGVDLGVHVPSCSSVCLSVSQSVRMSVCLFVCLFALVN